ncbi:ABC-type xenobiotic transporter [Malassezia cuniculi]|uniref:ABC-type xenobiotic transporter n=1 Tax=Malassezia cuniculi TaxID=948313 RepID=A0AAF0J7I8_9BASI|nr:ABC-type xenobiotic transporter [Malassezia cuniculi]
MDPSGPLWRRRSLRGTEHEATAITTDVAHSGGPAPLQPLPQSPLQQPQLQPPVSQSTPTLHEWSSISNFRAPTYIGNSPMHNAGDSPGGFSFSNYPPVGRQLTYGDEVGIASPETPSFERDDSRMQLVGKGIGTANDELAHSNSDWGFDSPYLSQYGTAETTHRSWGHHKYEDYLQDPDEVEPPMFATTHWDEDEAKRGVYVPPHFMMGNRSVAAAPDPLGTIAAPLAGQVLDEHGTGVADESHRSMHGLLAGKGGKDASSVDISDDGGDKPKPPADAVPKPAKLGDLFRYATPTERLLNWIGIVCACIVGIGQPLMTVLLGNLATVFLGTANRNIGLEEFIDLVHELHDKVNFDALMLVFIGIGTFVFTYIFMAIWVYTGETITLRIRRNYLRAILHQDVSYFDRLGAGEITTRIQSDIQLIQEGISDKLPTMMTYVSTFVAGFIVAYIRSWKLALVMTSILPCIVLTAVVLNIFVAKYQQIELQHVAKAASLAEESLSTVRTAKAFSIEGLLSSLYNQRNKEATFASKNRAIASGLGLGSFFFCVYSAYALAFYFGSKLVANGEIASGVVMNVIFAVLIGAFGLALLAPNLQALSFALAAGGKVYEAIDRKPPIDSSSKEGLRPPTCSGHISIRGVRFAYPARPDITVLHDYSLEIPAGGMTALVGPSGSGKSTIIGLVERFYDPIDGEVLLDGIPIKELNIQWLRTQIGLVAQEPQLFATTVWQNIAYGLTNTPYEHWPHERKHALVVEAARQANAHDFISQLPDGYDTLVGERATLLSGGQKQRVSIARAIVKNPKILLLDEATSALDTASEGVVQEALDRASRGRTTISVAHRLSTIKNAHNIVVMKAGEIVEQGTHASLLDINGGVYAGLVSTQRIQAHQAHQAAAIAAVKEEPHEFEAPLASRMSLITEGTLTSEVMKMSGITHSKMDADDEKRHSMAYLMLRLSRIGWDLLVPYFIPSAVCAVASGATYPSFAILFGLAIENFGRCQNETGQVCPEPQRGQMRHTANMHGLYFFIIAILSTIAMVLQVALIQQGSALLMHRLRGLMFRKYMENDVAYFDEDEHNSGVLTTTLAEHTQKINGFVGVSMGTIMQSVSTVITGSIIALIYGWKLALVVIACIPFTLSAGYVRLKLVIMRDVKVRKTHLESARIASESANAIRTVASLTREQDCLDRYDESLQKASLVAKRAAIYGNIAFALSQSCSYWVIALAFWYGSRLIVNTRMENGQEIPYGEYGTGQFFTILTSVVFGSIQAGNVFNYVPDISNAQVSASALFGLLDAQPEIEGRPDDGIDLRECRGHLRFEGVHFRYPTRPGVPVLRGVDLDVAPGTHCALVGPSGCGKSTTIQLIERFYDPQIGRITLDGYDIRTLSTRSLRRHVALVSQEPTLYDGTIAFNLRLGAEHPDSVTEAEMIQAARSANIYDFICGLPDGFETQVGGKGTQLSGGQKQRIAIARALIRNPKVLLLDEATSALDSDSEKIVQMALDAAASGRTTISIAHRLATIVRADNICAFEQGVVAESGNHEMLMDRNGFANDSRPAAARNAPPKNARADAPRGQAPPPAQPAGNAMNYVQEHMKSEHHISAFDMASFFQLHDLDRNNVLDRAEIEAIYGVHHSLSRKHSPDAEVHDEKADRIVKEVFRRLDKNGDGMITRTEFISGGPGGLPLFPEYGKNALGHHYDEESEFFVHHEEVYHKNPDQQTPEAYNHVEDLEHFSRHDAIDREEEDRERAGRGLPSREEEQRLKKEAGKNGNPYESAYDQKYDGDYYMKSEQEHAMGEIGNAGREILAEQHVFKTPNGPHKVQATSENVILSDGHLGDPDAPPLFAGGRFGFERAPQDHIDGETELSRRIRLDRARREANGRPRFGTGASGFSRPRDDADRLQEGTPYKYRIKKNGYLPNM